MSVAIWPGVRNWLFADPDDPMTDTEVLHPATERGENVAFPTVGRIVWVWDDPKRLASASAAIVTDVYEGDPNANPTLKISVHVFTVGHVRDLLEIPYGTKYERGPRWQWPPRA